MCNMLTAHSACERYDFTCSSYFCCCTLFHMMVLFQGFSLLLLNAVLSVTIYSFIPRILQVTETNEGHAEELQEGLYMNFKFST